MGCAICLDSSDDDLTCAACVRETTEALRTRLAAVRGRLCSLQWQIDHEGCAVAHAGEQTYECRAESPCGLCRMRQDRDAARAEAERSERALKDALNAACVCGGRGPDDDPCPACDMWHKYRSNLR